MGTDEIFKRKREERKARKYEQNTPKANSFLIVSEGKCTEPLYFNGLVEKIKEKVGGNITVFDADIEGQGCSTVKLIEVTDEIIKKAKIIYQNVWVVFDKDDFRDFDRAIEMAESKGYNVAWSNQSFEYWLYLHFYFSDSALHRDDWTEKLKEIFKECNLGDGTYRKNDKNIYDLVNINDGVNLAIKHAKRRMSNFDENKEKPSKFDPGTTVYKLVEELMKYLN